MMSIIAINIGLHKGGKRASLILDQYLLRVGAQAWAGYLSREGCAEMLKELREKASRNTAVQVLWQHDHRHEVLATLGHPGRFMDAMTSIGKKPAPIKLRIPDPFVRRIILMARAAGWWHDAGKLMPIFQCTVRAEKTGSHPIRHQTLSFYLLREWFSSGFEQGDVACKQKGAWSAGFGLEREISAAVVLTHHAKASKAGVGEYYLSAEKGFGSWTETDVRGVVLANIEASWLDAAQAAAQRLAAHDTGIVRAENHALAFYATRLAMMMADHAVSSLEKDPAYDGRADAHPDKDTMYAKSEPWIPLADHLDNVARQADHAAHGLFMHPWNRLENRPESMARSVSERFRWQEQAAAAIRAAGVAEGDGFFGAIIAETGSGKTQGGFRIMSALGGGAPRFTLGLGFGALAIQSGVEYRRDIGLNQEEVAIFVGHRHRAALKESERNLREADKRPDDMDFIMESSTGMDDLRLPAVFAHAMGRAKPMLTTPVVIMTIDHIMAAMEADRGGYVAGAIRAVTADLLIDEIDSFSPSDLHAIARLIYLVASFGRKVVVSSATMTPEIGEMLFDAYQSGYAKFQSAFGRGRLFAGVFSNRGLISQVAMRDDSGGASLFSNAFSRVGGSVAESLSHSHHRRRMAVMDIVGLSDENSIYGALAKQVIELALKHHTAMPDWGGAWFSTGFVRFNLVKRAQRFAMWLMQNTIKLEQEYGVRIRLNGYTSAMDSISRKSLERDLGKLLCRKHDEWSAMPVIHELGHAPKSTVFIVTTTPVIEVGRDYDFDWCILEPSSDMSIIQSAGRVLRHRFMSMPDEPNVILMGGSIRATLKEHVGAESYGYPGPGFQQKSPLGKDDFNWNEPWPRPLAEARILFGADVYNSGIHAGYRLTRARTAADRFDRETIQYVHLGRGTYGGASKEDDLCLKSFLGMENPWRDDRFDVIKFRANDEGESLVEMRYDHAKGWLDLSNPGAVHVNNFKPVTIDVSALLFAYRIEDGTRVFVPASLIDADRRFAASLGVLR